MTLRFPEVCTYFPIQPLTLNVTLSVGAYAE